MPAEDPTLRRIEVLLERDLDETGLARAEVLLEEAVALIRGYVSSFTVEVYPDLPVAALHVAASMVARVLAHPSEHAGVEQIGQNAGPFGNTVRFSSSATSGSPWLSAADKMRLRPFGGRVGSVSVASERTP